MAKYAIFGLGKSGLASLEYLGDKVAYCWDDNTEVSSSKFITPSEWNWAEIDALILAPGIPLTHPKPHKIVDAAHENNTPIICDIDLLWQDNQVATFIGITGTNGKSTTTALLAHVLQENGLDVAVGGNLGQAALTLGKHKYYVIEMSSYQLDLTQNTKFNIAIWLNTTPDHIDRHGDMVGYVSAKSRIFKNGNDTRIIGADDEIGKQLLQDFTPAIAISGKDMLPDFPNLPGTHNKQNISAVFAAAKALAIADEKITSAIRTFPGLEHRLEFVSEVGGTKFINDSKATNAESAMHALNAFENIHWLAGGVAKAGGITALAQLFSRVKKAYLFGQDGSEFAETLSGKCEYEIFDTLEDATKAAIIAANNEKLSTVLLSPACASFDQYKSFEARGDHFKQIVADFSQ